MPVSRDTLYEEVWAEPVLRVAERYQVSSSYLARVCRTLRIPTPAAGYWAKRMVGRAPPRPSLPAACPGDELEWDPGTALPRQLSSLRRVRSQPVGDATRSHELLAYAKPILERAPEVEGYLRPTKRMLVDLLVSKALLNRVLDVAGALFLELERRGHRVRYPSSHTRACRIEIDERENASSHVRVRTPWRPDRPTVVFIGGIAVGLTLLEIAEAVEVACVNGDYVPVVELRASKSGQRQLARSWWVHTRHRPSSRLRLQAYSPYIDTDWTQRWEEGQPGELTSLIPAIVESLEAAVPSISSLAEEAAQRAEVRRKEAEEWHRKWQAERAAEAQERRRKASIDNLWAIFAAWDERQRAEAFCKAIEQRAQALAAPERLAIEEKIAKAHQLLCRVDPLERFQSWIAPDSMGPDPEFDDPDEF